MRPPPPPLPPNYRNTRRDQLQQESSKSVLHILLDVAVMVCVLLSDASLPHSPTPAPALAVGAFLLVLDMVCLDCLGRAAVEWLVMGGHNLLVPGPRGQGGARYGPLCIGRLGGRWLVALIACGRCTTGGGMSAAGQHMLPHARLLGCGTWPWAPPVPLRPSKLTRLSMPAAGACGHPAAPAEHQVAVLPDSGGGPLAARARVHPQEAGV